MRDGASRERGTLSAHSALFERVVDLRQVFPAPREALFRAWTDPRELAKWWGPVGWTVVECTVDLRQGGRWRTLLAPPGRVPVGVGGTYLEIVPPERLGFTWEPEGEAHPPSIVTLAFAPHADGTEIQLSHRKLTDAGKVDMDVGWARTFDSLAAYCRAARGTPPPHASGSTQQGGDS
jgi:uncharacterized protein YndB with AHSA1/START domain